MSHDDICKEKLPRSCQGGCAKGHATRNKKPWAGKGAQRECAISLAAKEGAQWLHIGTIQAPESWFYFTFSLAQLLMHLLSTTITFWLTQSCIDD
eukprot:1158115-Pelagomonas_calceolata.AAC.4